MAIQGTEVVLGGTFHGVEDIPSRGVAMWDGSRWKDLGNGLQPDELSTVSTAYDLAFDGQGGFYAAGLFGTAGTTKCRGVAHWSGSAWKCLELGFAFEPQSTGLGILDGQVYIGSYHGVLKWNGTAWDSLLPMVRGEVTRIRTSGGKLWAAGRITVDGDTTIRNLAFREGDQWIGLGRGPGPVRDLAMIRKDVFVIESYRKVDRTDSTVVIHWNGSGWNRVDDSLPKCVFTNLAADSQEVYLVGHDRAEPKLRLFKWDGKGFKAYRTESFFGATTEARLSGGKFYLGGAFPGIGGVRADNLAVWDGVAWKAVSSSGGTGPYQIAETMESNGKDLYLGGRFIRYGGKTPAAGVLRWDGLGWDTMAGGFKDKIPFYSALDMTVRAFAFKNDTVYAGGFFDSSQSEAARNIAQWDGTAWRPMGEGFPGTVHGLEVMEYGLVVGGKPDSGSLKDPLSPLKGQAVGLWAGGAWKALGNGPTGEVRKLASYKGELYAMGKIKLAENDSVQGIAKWTGSQWVPLPSSPSGFRFDSVFAATVFKDELYFLGRDRFSPRTEHRLAKWDGQNFRDLQKVVQSTSLAADENFLYMSMLSSRQEVSQLVESNLARWNVVSGWQSLTSDMGALTYFAHGEVLTLTHSLAVHGDYLYVSALFAALNGKPVYCLARWKRDGVISTRPILVRNKVARKGFLQYVGDDNYSPTDVDCGGNYWRFNLQGREISGPVVPGKMRTSAASMLIQVDQ